jgi:predicted class III extradiol MEMO1 family dioxygenase
MDWKTFYRDETSSPEGRARIRRSFENLPVYDEEIDRVIREKGVLSFPHTSVFYSGEAIARVVAGLHRNRIDKVIALGVLHGNALPSPYRESYREYIRRMSGVVPAESNDEAWEIFHRLQGGFVRPGAIRTVFGELPCPFLDQIPEDLLREDAEILQNEFSLDLFLDLISFHGQELGATPLAVLPLYVGLTRDPAGSYETASRLAACIAHRRDERTAVVATGDLVHYGNAYCHSEEMRGMPADVRSLTPHFLSQVRDTLALGLSRRDYNAFHDASTRVLKSDQWNVLPVVAELLGGGAEFEILSFALSDYASILGVAPPCVVASTLAAFLPPEFPEGEAEPTQPDAGAYVG